MKALKEQYLKEEQMEMERARKNTRTLKYLKRP